MLFARSESDHKSLHASIKNSSAKRNSSVLFIFTRFQSAFKGCAKAQKKPAISELPEFLM